MAKKRSMYTRAWSEPPPKTAAEKQVEAGQEAGQEAAGTSEEKTPSPSHLPSAPPAELNQAS